MNRLYLIVFLITAFSLSCERGYRNNYERSVESIERQKVAFEICSLESVAHDLEIKRIMAKAYGKPNSILNEFKQKSIEISNLSDSLNEEYRKLTFLQSHGFNYEIVTAAQHHLIQSAIANVKIPISSAEKDSLFRFIRRGGEVTITQIQSRKDTTKKLFISQKCEQIVNNYGGNWEAMSYEDQFSINVLVSAAENLEWHDYFPVVYQTKDYTCAPSCLKMIGDYYGNYQDLDELEVLCKTTYPNGTTIGNLEHAAFELGLGPSLVTTHYDGLVRYTRLPFIAFWDESHFVVVYKINEKEVWVADPAKGKIKFSKADFCDHWMRENDQPSSLGCLITFNPERNFF